MYCRPKHFRVFSPSFCLHYLHKGPICPVICKRVLYASSFNLYRLFRCYIINKRPLDSYACPDQSNRNRTNQQIFLNAKNIQNWCYFMGKRTVCVQSLTFFAQKALFSTQFFGVKMLDYKAVSSVIFTTGMCPYMCKRFHQV